MQSTILDVHNEIGDTNYRVSINQRRRPFQFIPTDEMVRALDLNEFNIRIESVIVPGKTGRNALISNESIFGAIRSAVALSLFPILGICYVPEPLGSPQLKFENFCALLRTLLSKGAIHLLCGLKPTPILEELCAANHLCTCFGFARAGFRKIPTIFVLDELTRREGDLTSIFETANSR